MRLLIFLLHLQLKKECLEQPCLISDSVLAPVHLDFFQGLFDDSFDVPAVDLAVLEELDALLDDRVPDRDHVLRQVLDERQETPLGVEPSVSPQLFVVRLQGLDDPRNAELVVALGAVQSPYK